MDCQRLITSLRAVRRYRPDPIPEETLRRILEAGRWTGSAKNTQPWAFVVVTDPEVRARLSECGAYAGSLADAPLVVVTVRLPEGGDFDMGRLCQSMMLAAWAEGVGSCPVTLHREERARRVLGVPEDHGARWAIAFGYPHPEGGRRPAVVRAHPPRKPLSELVRREAWGE